MFLQQLGLIAGLFLLSILLGSLMELIADEKARFITSVFCGYLLGALVTGFFGQLSFVEFLLMLIIYYIGVTLGFKIDLKKIFKKK